MNIIDTILTSILGSKSKSKKDIARSVAENHPEVKAMQKELDKKAEELDRKRDKFHKPIEKKYKGTSLEKYFRFDDDKK